MWGEFIGLKSVLFGFAPPLFPRSPTWGANMAWKRGMSSTPITHCCCAVNWSLRGEGKKVIPHFHPDQDSPFLWRLQTPVIRIHGAQPGVPSQFSVLRLRVIVLSAPASSLTKRPSSIIANLAPFFSLSSLSLFFLSHSLFKLSSGAGLFNLLEAFKMPRTSDAGDNG